MALRKALSFALEIGIRKVIVAGDSVLAICAVKNQQMNHSIAGNLVESIKKLIPSFLEFGLKHVRKSGNTVADCLAKHSKQYDVLQVGLEDSPNFINDLLIKDRSSYVINPPIPD
ncbi:hypothetical protein REPUB_Repub02eG0054400 [Reevesia pubescens]